MLHQYTEYYQQLNINSGMYFSIVYDLFTRNFDKVCEFHFINYDTTDNFKEAVLKDFLIIIVFQLCH